MYALQNNYSNNPSFFGYQVIILNNYNVGYALDEEIFRK